MNDQGDVVPCAAATCKFRRRRLAQTAWRGTPTGGVVWDSRPRLLRHAAAPRERCRTSRSVREQREHERRHMKAAARTLVLVLGVRLRRRAKPAPRPAPAAATPTMWPRPAARDTTPDAGCHSAASSSRFLIPCSRGKRSRSLATPWSRPADSTVPEGPTWDIDVRSYETHRRVEFYVNAFTRIGARAVHRAAREGARATSR